MYRQMIMREPYYLEGIKIIYLMLALFLIFHANCIRVNADFNISALINSQNQTVDFRIHYQRVDWLCIVLADHFQSADAIILQANQNKLIVTDAYFQDSVLLSDQQQDIQLIWSKLSAFKCSLQIRRKLETGDLHDRAITHGVYTFGYAGAAFVNSSRLESFNFFNISIGESRRLLATYKDTDMKFTYVVDAYLTIKWKMINKNKTMEMALIHTKPGWFGIALKDVMSASDMIVVEVASSKATVSDYHCLKGSRVPLKDKTNNIKLISQEVTADSVSVRFQRKLDTGDPYDLALRLGPIYGFSYAICNNKSRKEIVKHTYKRTFDMNLTEDGPLEFEEQEEEEEETDEAGAHRIDYKQLLLLAIACYI